jgi:hypothetical protein
MFHWPITEDTLRKMNEEFDELAWELEAISSRLADRLPPNRQGQIDMILRRADSRRRWLRNVLTEMHDDAMDSDDAFSAMSGPLAKA